MELVEYQLFDKTFEHIEIISFWMNITSGHHTQLETDWNVQLKQDFMKFRIVKKNK